REAKRIDRHAGDRGTLRTARCQARVVSARDGFHADHRASRFGRSDIMTLMKARLLIVEDEAIVAMDLQQRLEHLGHEVVGTAATGEAAIQRAEEARPDVTLMDIRLKGEMDGIAAAAEIDRRFGTPVVFLTAHSDTQTVQRATA